MIVTRYHLSNQNLQQVFSTITAEMEEEEQDAECNTNNVTMYNFIQSPVTTNTPRKKTEVPNERPISLDILAEMMKGFNKLMLQSTTNDCADDHSEKNNAESDPKRDQVVDTHTSDRNPCY